MKRRGRIGLVVLKETDRRKRAVSFSPNSPTPAMPQTVLASVSTGFRRILPTVVMTNFKTI